MFWQCATFNLTSNVFYFIDRSGLPSLTYGRCAQTLRDLAPSVCREVPAGGTTGAEVTFAGRRINIR